MNPDDAQYETPAPDRYDPALGRTILKRHPPYVHGARGMLLHEVREVELWWYDFALSGTGLVRLKSPRMIIRTKCDQTFFGQSPLARGTKQRAKTCQLPKPGAVLCGRCRGEGPVFARGCKPGRSGIDRHEARARLGCVMTTEGETE